MLCIACFTVIFSFFNSFKLSFASEISLHFYKVKLAAVYHISNFESNLMALTKSRAYLKFQEGVAQGVVG